MNKFLAPAAILLLSSTFVFAQEGVTDELLNEGSLDAIHVEKQFHNKWTMPNLRFSLAEKSGVVHKGEIYPYDSLASFIENNRLESITLVKDQNEIRTYTDRDFKLLILVQFRKED